MSLQILTKMGCEFCIPSEDLLIRKTKNFFIMHDPYPLNLGHLIITTRRHYGCGGELREKVMSELMMIKLLVTEMLLEQSSNIIFYEHGRTGTCLRTRSDGNICYHMHLHVMPFQHITSEMLTILPNPKRISYAEVPSFYINMGPYLYFEELNQEGIVYATRNHKLPPHFFRTVLSAINKTPERANWEKYPDNGLLQTSKKAFPKEKFINLDKSMLCL